MTSDLWSPPPSFVQGQIFSAELHGNALVSAIDMLLGAYQGPEIAYQSGRTGEGWGSGFGTLPDDYRRIFHGLVRHKADTLSVGVRVERIATGTMTIRVRANLASGTVTSTATITAGSGTVDSFITANVAAQAAGTFYEVFVDIKPNSGSVAIAQPLYCYEVNPQTYATLAAFATGAPTAAQWNDLSGRATLLWAQQTGGAAIPVSRYEVTSDDNVAEHSTGRYVIRHKHRWLAWQVRVRKDSATNSSDAPGFVAVSDHSGYYPLFSYAGHILGGVGYAVLGARLEPEDTTIAINGMGYPDNQVIYPNNSHIKVGGEVILLGERDGLSNRFNGISRAQEGTTVNPLGENTNTRVRTWQAEEDTDKEQTQYYVTWRGVWDLKELEDIAAIAVGTQYEVQVYEAGEGAPEGGYTGHFQLDYLYEVSSTTPTLTGWSAMTAYAYDTIIAENGTSKAVRDNLTWLSSRVVYRNHAAPWIGERHGPLWGGYFVRQKRWLLYYYGDATLTPEIRYFHAHSKEPQTVALTGGKPYEALSYDLEAAEGLTPGVMYGVYGVAFALEDDEQT